LQNNITQNATFVGANRYVRWRIPLRLLAAHATFAGAWDTTSSGFTDRFATKNTLFGSHKLAFWGLHIDEKRL